MSAHGTAGPLPITRKSQPNPVAARSYRGQRWHVAFNIALALVLVATLGLGAWRATDGFQGIGNGGDDPGPGGNTAFAPETRVFTPEAEEATPDLPLVPTAAECTVTPLTIDQVLWYVEDPGAASRYRSPEDVATPDPASSAPEATIAPDGTIDDSEQPVMAATPPDAFTNSLAADFEPGAASPDQLAAIASVQRMWMACVLADSPFQRWALESPALVAEQVNMLLPNYASEDDARAILQGVQETGKLMPSDDFWKQPNASYQMLTSQGYPTGGSLALIEADNAEAWTNDGREFWVTYSSYTQDGTLERDGNLSAVYTPESDEPTRVPGLDANGGCNRFGVTWFPDRGDLLISYYPHCG